MVATHVIYDRYCKTDKHAEILVPYIHFDMRHYDENILDHIQDFNRKYVGWGCLC